MDAVLNQGVVQVVGAFIVAAVVLQVMIMLTASIRRISSENEQNRLSQDNLVIRVDTALAAYHLERKTIEEGWNGHRKFEITMKTKEVEGVHSFYLSPHDGKPLPPFLPGQYLTFAFKVPDEPKPVVRCYSLSDGATNSEYYRITVKKIPPPPDTPDGNPGLSSTYLNDVAEEGDIIDVKAPSGHFHLKTERNRPLVLIGGGIGVTPVLSMLNTLCNTGFKGEVWFFFGVRNSAEHLMKEHLEAIASEHSNVHLHICYSQPLDDDVEGQDYQHQEFVSVDLFKKLLPSNNYDFYICGPPPMMESLTSALYEWGVPKDDVNFEAFGMATVKKAAKPEGELGTSAKPANIEVTFARSGKTVKWDDSASSILDLAETNGVAIDCACRSGGCGTCITAIKSGDVEYLVEPGHQPEAGSCLTCISVPAENLELDA